eukprot:7630905-Lingulodinium_polyedra.AAC.1
MRPCIRTAQFHATRREACTHVTHGLCSCTISEVHWRLLRKACCEPQCHRIMSHRTCRALVLRSKVVVARASQSAASALLILAVHAQARVARACA